MLLVGGAALAAWLAAAATTGVRDAVDPIRVEAPAIDANADALASEIARLHEHLRPTTTPRQPVRNLFTYGARQPRPAPPPVAPAAVTEGPRAGRPATLPPSLKLSGIAEDTSSGAVVRTAVISAGGQLFLVKEGESVTTRFQVTRISGEVVELADLADGSTRRLALK